LRKKLESLSLKRRRKSPENPFQNACFIFYKPEAKAHLL